MNPRVFVSSTCFDLIDARAELGELIRELGLVPILSDMPDSEFEVNPDINSIATCLENVKGSGFVLMVLSKRYGRSLLKSGFPDLSATHLEYRSAKEHGIPIFMYVRDRLLGDRGSENPKWIKGDDKRLFELIDEHKQLKPVGSSNWFDPFSSTLDLKRLVRRDLGGIARRLNVERQIREGSLPIMAMWIDVDRFPGGVSGIVSNLEIHLEAKSGYCYDVQLNYGDFSRNYSFMWVGHRKTIHVDAKMNDQSQFFDLKYRTTEGHWINDRWTLRLIRGNMGMVLVHRKVTPGDAGFIEIIDPN